MAISMIPAADLGGFLSGDPRQIAQWIATTDRKTLLGIADDMRRLRDSSRPATRDQAGDWVTRDPNRPTVPQHKPPLVGPRDHVTVASRLAFQGRGLHIPYIRASVLATPVTSGQWWRPTLHADDDPYQLASGDGFVLNQDGIWTTQIKVDWSPTPDSVASGTSRAARLEVNGNDVGVRDYLDDDADTTTDVINTLVFTDQYQAGTTITVGVRAESVPKTVTLKANIYVRSFLVRCAEGPYDHYTFPAPPPPPNTPPPKDPPVRGTRPPAQPRDRVVYAERDPGLQINTYYPNGTPMTVHSGGNVYYSTDGKNVKVTSESNFYGTDTSDVIHRYL